MKARATTLTVNNRRISNRSDICMCRRTITRVPIIIIVLRHVQMSLLFEILQLFTVKVLSARFRISVALWKFCLTVFFIHPEEDRQVGRNIGVLQKRVLSSFVFSIYMYMYMYMYMYTYMYIYMMLIYEI